MCGRDLRREHCVQRAVALPFPPCDCHRAQETGAGWGPPSGPRPLASLGPGSPLCCEELDGEVASVWGSEEHSEGGGSHTGCHLMPQATPTKWLRDATFYRITMIQSLAVTTEYNTDSQKKSPGKGQLPSPPHCWGLGVPRHLGLPQRTLIIRRKGAALSPVTPGCVPDKEMWTASTQGASEKTCPRPALGSLPPSLLGPWCCPRGTPISRGLSDTEQSHV